MNQDMRKSDVKNLITTLTLAAACLLPGLAPAADMKPITPPSSIMAQDKMKQ